MSEPANVTIKFRWVSVSPEPHNVTMRNSLEPVDVFVQVEVPLKHEYIANSEPIIQVQLGVDDEKEPETILTKEGMRVAIDQLSLEAIPESEVSEEEWGEENDEGSEEWGNENEGSNDDDDWDKE